jgi:hypothetical protein
MVSRKFSQFTDAQRRAAVHEDPAAMKLPGGIFGPWRPGIDEAERRAGLRALAALTVVFAGSAIRRSQHCGGRKATTRPWRKRLARSTACPLYAEGASSRPTGRSCGLSDRSAHHERRR